MGMFKPPKQKQPETAVKVETNVDPDHGDALKIARQRAANAEKSQGAEDFQTADLQTGGQRRGGVSLS